jgi:photosystem II stability/assembly factor-like uncharacterized protein
LRIKYGSLALGIIIVISILACGIWQSNLGNSQAAKNSSSINGEKPFSNSTTSTPGASSQRTLDNLESIHMVNAMMGWALSQGSLLRTVDGGASWTNVTPKGVERTSVGTLLVYDAQTLWVVFNKESSTSISVYRTTDGGQKWESAVINTTPNHGRVTSLAFLDSTHGWLLTSYGVAMGSESIEVFQTNDGGTSWKSTASTSCRQAISIGLPFTGDKNGIIFANQKNGWLTGFSHGDGIWLYSSSDGGRTWTQKTIIAPHGYHTDGGAVSTEPPHFFNQKEGLLPVEFRGENPPAFVFYRTEDGGLSWTPTTPFQTAKESQEYRGFHWSIIDATHAFVSDGYQLYLTSDGSHSFVRISPNISLEKLQQLDFTSEKLGWAIIDGGLWKTMDGGHTWVRI